MCNKLEIKGNEMIEGVGNMIFFSKIDLTRIFSVVIREKQD